MEQQVKKRVVTTPAERMAMRKRRQARRLRKKIIRVAVPVVVGLGLVCGARGAGNYARAEIASASAKAAVPIEQPSVFEPEVPEGFDAASYSSYRKAKAAENIEAVLSSSRVIAHAGGAYREGKKLTVYTNSAEAFDQNYERGLRAFEIDLQLTADGDLACTHDWYANGTADGTALSASQWVATGVKTSTGTQLEGMLVSGVFREIATKSDAILLADTKAFEYEYDDAVTIYKRLVEAFAEVDPDWLLNVAPYVYSEQDYQAAMSVYEWPYVVYAAYANDDTPDEIWDFVRTHENAGAICLAKNDERLTSELISLCHERSVLVLTYTTNKAAEAEKLFERGVDVIISDSLSPSDLTGADEAAA